MKLSDLEKAMLAGDQGEPRRLAMEQLLEAGRFFDAQDFVEISQVHLMADTEAVGVAGVEFLEKLAAYPLKERRVCVPAITDPRGADFKAYQRIRQAPEFVELEKRADKAFRELGLLMTDTCIIYQTVQAPVLGQHVAYGDTGSSIYANSVLGARTNFEGGPSALAAAMTGRVPRYGFHLDERRRGSTLFELKHRPQCLSDWGAVGGFIGRRMGSYWEVPVISGVQGAPTSDELKHFGAALASFGSTPMFHMIGVTPEAPSLDGVFDGATPAATPIGEQDIAEFYAGYGTKEDTADVVVFAAPQMSLFEMQQLAELLDGEQVHENTTVLVATSPEVKFASQRMGLVERIEASGAIVLEGVCFYQMHAREIGEANGWRTLVTNSAKLVNIIGGYGYEPVLRPMERCIASAIAGKVLP